MTINVLKVRWKIEKDKGTFNEVELELEIEAELEIECLREGGTTEAIS